MAVETDGNEVAAFNLGRIYISNRKLEQAKKYFKISADKNHIGAQYELAQLYERENMVDAIRYYTMASKQGHLRSSNRLLYLYGYGNNKDFNKGLDLILTKDNIKQVDTFYMRNPTEVTETIKTLTAKNKKLEEENLKQKNYIEELEVRPGGPKYELAKSRFETCQEKLKIVSGSLDN